MNKKEISEIKSQLTITSSTITRISGCYVDGEKEKRAVFTESFQSMPEGSIFKYLEIFRKVLGGTVGKALYNLPFPKEQEQDGGAQNLLAKLCRTKLKSEDELTEFFDKVIENYAIVGNFLILLVHADYDIPGAANDGTFMDDASDMVYSHIICAICPVELSKPGLSYHEQDGDFQECARNWMIGQPEVGFLFPAFNDRSVDLHEVLYHVKSAKNPHHEVIESVLGCSLKHTGDEQVKAFQQVVEETLSENCDYDAVKSLVSNLEELVMEQEKEPSQIPMKKETLLSVLEENLEDDAALTEAWDEIVGEDENLLLGNIATGGKQVIKMNDVEIHSRNRMGETIEMRNVNGRNFLMIPVEGDFELNGILVKANKKAKPCG